MSTQAEAADQVVKIMLDGSEHAIKIAGAGAKQIAVLLYAILKDQKRTKGKVRLTNMLRSNKELRIFPVRQEDVKLFCKEAKAYGVLYCALRLKKSKDGVVDIMARAEDASKINRIFDRYGMTAVEPAKLEMELAEKLEGHNTGKEVPERARPKRDPEDLFLDELFSPAPNKEQAHSANPTMQAGPSAPSRSAPSSEKSRAPRSDPERIPATGKPSVRKELEEIKQAQETKRKPKAPQRVNYPEHKHPEPKERRTHHEHQPR
jgi:hypothetical protein